MKRTLAFLLLAVACKRNPHVSSGEIEQLTRIQPEKIVHQKKYQLDESASLEDVALFESGQKSHLVVVAPAEKGYTLLRQFSWPAVIAEPKLFFISIGNKKSHILVTHGKEQKVLNLFDAAGFTQEFTPAMAETASVKIVRNEEKPNDEFLTLGTVNYRFNGIRWLPFAGDEIFPYLETFSVSGDQSLIEITNRGSFGTRVNLTLAFAGITADADKKLRLTKDIPTVRLYRAGFPVHKNGGGNVALPHPLVEIQKDSWGKNGRIKLPLFMNDVGRLTMRAVYSQRGRTESWPAAQSPGVIKDGQGYWAVER